MSEEAEEEGQQQDEGPPNPDQHIPVPLETLGWSDVMKEQTCAFMSTYCVQGMCWCLWFISPNITAFMHPGWLTHHPVPCGSDRSATCPRSPSLAGQGWDWTPGPGFPVLSSCCLQLVTSSEVWAPHLQGPVLSHLELKVLLISCPQHSRDMGGAGAGGEP